MDAPVLVNFPLPMMTALLSAVISGLIWRLDLGPARANVLFCMLFGLCATEALLVGLRFGYGITAFVALQRMLPLYLGPTIYLGFVALAVPKQDFVRLALAHLSAPIVVMGLFWMMIQGLRQLDWIISASYLFYIAALYVLWCKGPDALSFARIDVTGRLSNWIIRAIGLLLFILLLDGAIALDFALNAGANVPALISYGTVPLVLVLLAVLITLPQMVARAGGTPQSPLRSDTADVETEARVQALMTQDQLFLDPDLTVQRLAKRLHLPARTVSGAINKVRGMNVSQYVNEFRLAFAADLLANVDLSVTEIARQSGFMTRSNFYREFQRVFGQSPTAYRNAAKSAKPPTS